METKLETTAVDPVLARRSIRKFKSRSIPKEMINTLLKAAMAAPSADDERPWHFILINDRYILGQIPGIHSHAQMVQTVPLAILVCGDLSLQKVKGFWIQDCSAATENMLIEAQMQGLGAVWLGVYPIEGRMEAFRHLFRLPESIVPFSLVALGYPDEHKAPSDRFDDSRIHYNCWVI